MEAMMMKSSLMLYVFVLLLSFALVQAQDGEIAPSPAMENGAAGFFQELLCPFLFASLISFALFAKTRLTSE
ncbi:hypothetical protein KFK09_002455 [Dendrobium nobile]|uniref:Uncharacterized protein n=1 Tax=Dendrobium nobile TaxID=94219 RepID=A0A8T3C796_DENNO|nr:hypothetical protein KFK09_002455 [Dendrobium nobile]